MFDLVADIDKYQDFMPWCGGSKIEYHNDTQTKASIIMIIYGISNSFTTINRYNYPNKIDIELVDGPFSYLSGSWRFTEKFKDSCNVEFELEYSFSNKLLSMIISPVFSNIANSFIYKFQERASHIYGKKI
ncbi:cyclase [Candidatus Kinetoplastibacterium blastocrithidii (ex Strigomonas culicis)]|nr:cyclase [Candidatus Kinetoplastibacterium blastocrithidii (ex Strigomonas culicis)]